MVDGSRGVLFVFYVWAVQWVDTTVVAVIQNLYPVGAIWFMWLGFRSVGRYQRVSGSQWALIGVMFAAMGFVVAGGGDPASNTGWSATLIGVLLSVVSVVAGAANGPLSIRVGFLLRGDVERNKVGSNVDSVTLETVCTMVALVVSKTALLPVMLLVGWWAPGSLDLSTVVAAVTGGLLLIAPGAWMFRRANIVTRRLTINLIGYSQGLVSLGLLLLLSSVSVREPLWVVGGGMVVALTGGLLNITRVHGMPKRPPVGSDPV